ncbi:hypothetical protein HAX54_052634 [Datura stramonium]|uniref:Uncharacterized protein n=1 Tax=Datura stramonium TaxID=4076 RepID=A0ABS8RRM9_DATST|nr:hypothetical protein [Datura stramonium]
MIHSHTQLWQMDSDGYFHPSFALCVWAFHAPVKRKLKGEKEMAKECCNVIGAINLVKARKLDSLTINQLDNAGNHLGHVVVFLSNLEKCYPENGISKQLRPLFLEAHDGFSEISHTTGRSPYTIKMISSVLKIIKLENIAGRIKASKPSRSSSRISMNMVGFVKVLLDYVQDHAPFPSVLLKKLESLKIFLKFTAKRCVEHESMKDLFTHAEDVAYTAAHLCFLGLAYNIESEFSKLLERISPFRPKLRQIYLSVLIGSKSSRSSRRIRIHINSMFDFVIALLEDLKELQMVAIDDRIPWFQQGLCNFSSFLWDIELERTPHEEFKSLLSHIEALAIEAAVVIYSYDKEMENDYEEMQKLFLLQLKFNQVKVEVNLIQLPNSEATITAPLDDLIDYVREELIFVRTFVMDSLEQCTEQTKIIDLLTLIQSTASQAWSVISSVSHGSKQEGLAKEIDLLHFQLLLKFKFIKAVIRQMCSNISASPTLDHPMMKLLEFLPFNFEVIDSYFSMLKFSKTLFSDSLKMDELLMGFHEYIIDNLLKCVTNLTYTVMNEVKKFYFGLLLLVTYLVDPLVQFIGRKKQNKSKKVKSSRSVHWKGFGTTVIEGRSAFSLSIEDTVDSNKSRKVDLVLQFLTEAVKLLKYERSLKHYATVKAHIFDLIKRAYEELVFIGTFLMDVLRQHTELDKLHDLLMHTDETAHKLAKIRGYSYESFMDSRNNEEMRLSLVNYLQEIESLKVEIRKICCPCNMTGGEGLINFLLNHQDRMLNYDVCSISFLKGQIPVVKDKLESLRSFLADIVQYHNMHQELKDGLKPVQDIKYVCLFPIWDYRPAWYYMLYLSDVKQLLRVFEAEVKMVHLKVPDSSGYSFPKTNGLGFLNSFLGKLEELLRSKLDSIVELKHPIESVKEGLLCLKSLTLTDRFTESLDEQDEVCHLISSGSEMAYKAEHVIDSCLACSHPLWYKVVWISDVVENIKLVNKVVRKTCQRKKVDATVSKAAETSTNLSPFLSVNTPTENEEMVGFQDAIDELKNQLFERSPQLDVISIIGMPGLGKTTLAKKIYNDPIVISHFDIRAQCRVTQVYSWRELLLTILNGVLEPADRDEKEEGELADELRRFLLTKRFLLLIDDVWDNYAWDNLHMCFKDAQNGSRIILTTRLSDVAIYAKCESEPYHLRLFRDDESWTLLQKEVFQGEMCPCELEDVGFRIAKCCRGLPLSIVLVAGVLKQKKNEADLWKVVEESLGSKSIGSLEESMSIIGLSYKNLPHHLKPCFLYFGGFLKGKDIHVSKLTQLWQAEGFVQANKETGAKDYLEDLIRRNLVMGMEKRPNGKLKTCGIHDLLHTFCLEKAKQENFLLQINSGEDVFPENPKEYRLFIHSNQDEIDLWRPTRSNVRSLLFNTIDPDNLLWPRDISFIFDSFKLVKVLDLESFNIGGTFPTEIQYLIQMKYFAAQTDANSIPSSIAKLWNLETFVVRGLGGEMILPCSLLKMVKLRHVHVNHRVSLALHENMDESLANSQLANLETFSTLHLSYGEDAEKILRYMPKLRKLSCMFSGTFGYSKKVTGRCVLFPRLDFLSHLESLKLISNSYPAKLPHEFNFPSKLRELTLSKFRLPWTQISTIAELPNLEILKLCLRTFEGDLWEVKDSEFPELKYLKMDNLKVAQWSVSDDAFPKLERLVLMKCKRLEKIPSHFGDAVSLRSIEVSWCSWTVANSAQEIQTTQREDMANDAFIVTIQPPDWTRRSSP